MAIHNEILKRQSRVQKEGDAWEIFVMNFCNKELEGSGIRVIRGKTIRKGSKLWEELAVPARKNGEKVWGDIDLVAIDDLDKPIAIISCKLSLHGRFSETLFYAAVLKDILKYIKVVFATPDKGRQAGSGKWESEWGSEEKPTKDRSLGEYYLDGIYIHNNKTNLGGKVKSLKELPNDLIEWRKQINK